MGLVYESLYRLSLGVGSRVSAKFAKGLEERNGLGDRLKAAAARWTEAPLWIHVASAGELEQAIAVLEEIKNATAWPTVLTYFSPSAASAVRREVERRPSVPWDFADYSPLDTSQDVNAFVEIVRPRAFVAVHRELWPGILEACTERAIPCALIAAQWRQGLPWLQKRWLRRFTFVATSDEKSRELASGWLPKVRIETLGDPRIARVLSRKTSAGTAPWAAAFEDRPTLVAASIWPSDFTGSEPFLRQAMEANWRLVLVPHEPEEKFLRRLEHWLTRLKAPHGRWSEWNGTDRPDHLVVDRVGLLAELYQIASLVFVGGSFEKKVHNVLEPAAYGRPILTGPYIQNSLEAVEMNGEGLLAAGDARDLIVKGRTLLKSEEERRARGDKALNYLLPRQDSPRRIATALVTLSET